MARAPSVPDVKLGACDHRQFSLTWVARKMWALGCTDQVPSRKKDLSPRTQEDV